MKIQLSDHFTYRRLLRFTLPSVVMMVFISIYGVVDGFFVSNLVGKTPFTAVNFIYPVLMVLGAVGFMFGTGGSALVGMVLGQGERERANRIFSLLICTLLLCAVIIALLGVALLPAIAALLGAEGELLEQCVLYGRIVLIALPFQMLQFALQSFMITAEKPNLGLIITLLAGVTNMVLDPLFMAVFKWGLAGAAAATALSQAVGGLLPLIYFLRPNDSLLRLTRPQRDANALRRTCTNGSSELMSNISMSLVSMLYNAQLMRYAGADGVAAYGVLMYVNMIFLAIFIGYSTGMAPVVSFHYGANDREELQSLRRKSLLLIAVTAVLMLLLAQTLGGPLSRLFVGYDAGLLAMTEHAFSIYAYSFLFCGFAIWGSSFFTALNDGLTSALISFLRTLVFQVAAVLLLPLLWGLDGVWVSITAAELVAAGVTGAFLAAKRGKYGY